MAEKPLAIWRRCARAVLLAAPALFALGCGGGDEVITIFAASSLTEVMPVVMQRYEQREPGVAFTLSLSGSQTLASQIEEGAPADLFISANPVHARRLVERGLVERSAVLVENRLVVAVERDSALREVADLALAGVRIAVGAPGVPVGALTETALTLLERDDPELARALRRNVVTEDPNVRVALSRVELGEADAAFVYHTDVAVVPGLRAIELPAEIPRNEYVLTLIVRDDPQALERAARFFDFLLGVEAGAIFARAGFTALALAEGSSP